MQIILREDVAGLGKRGDIVDVADGHARNFLFPKGKAMKASEGAIAQAAKMRRSRDLRDAESREAATAIASKLVSTVINVAAKTSSEGKLFGSVHASDISDAVLAQTGIEVDRKNLIIDEAIKTTGQHTVMAELHPEVSFPIRVEVADADAEATADAE